MREMAEAFRDRGVELRLIWGNGHEYNALDRNVEVAE
jgi:hypothetical protein